MLEKGVAAVKADKAKALDTINKGEGRIPGPRYSMCFASMAATATSLLLAAVIQLQGK